MAKRRIGIVALVLWLLSYSVLAVSTTDAKEPIITDAECELTLCYRNGETAFADEPVALYQIADVSSDFQYTLRENFVASGLILNGIQNNGEWDVIRSTLKAFIVGNDIAPTKTAVTDASGEVHLTQLETGLYLVSAVCAEGYFFDSALIALPNLNSDGFWQYQVTVLPKGGEIDDEEIELKVLKLWKGDGSGKNRPVSIEVEIFCDEVSVETVILSEENNWSYSWKAKDDGAVWTVVERNIPTGYTVSVEDRTTTFVLTNTLNKPDAPKPPHTGDTSNILLYIVLMHVSGIALVIFGLTRKRKQHES